MLLLLVTDDAGHISNNLSAAISLIIHPPRVWHTVDQSGLRPPQPPFRPINKFSDNNKYPTLTSGAALTRRGEYIN